MKLFTIFTISLLVCIVTSSYAFSQPDLFGNKLILGIRDSSPPVTRFCQDFEVTLQKSVGKDIKVTHTPVQNYYKGELFSRYQGLLKDKFDKDHIDIECGPNSVLSGDLPNPIYKREKFLDRISFPKPFFYTGSTKLLLKKDLADRLSQSTQLAVALENIKIGVMKDTSTWLQLENNKSVYKSIAPIEAKPMSNSSDSSRGINALERALRILDKNGSPPDNSSPGDDLEFDAFAGNAITLQYFLKDGVKGSGSGSEGDIRYIKERKGYNNLKYAIFPSTDILLPGLKEEDYAMAIKKGGKNESWLSEKIREALGDLDTPGSKLKEDRDILKSYETGQTLSPKPSPTPTPTITGQTDSTQRTDLTHIPTGWEVPVPITVALITVIGGIVVAILNPQLVVMIKNWLTNLFGKVPPQPPQNPLQDRTITGRVINARTGAWVIRAKVSLEAIGTPAIEFTDTLGIFEFSIQNSINKIRVRVEAEGYEMLDQRIDLSNSGKIPDIGLSPK